MDRQNGGIFEKSGVIRGFKVCVFIFLFIFISHWEVLADTFLILYFLGTLRMDI